MERLATPTRVLRVDSRYRHRAPLAAAYKEADSQPRAQEEEAGQRRGRDTMTKDHRLFHRRQAQPATEVVTVEVVETVDSEGNVLSQETLAPQAPAQPTIDEAAADAVPPVPAVVAEAISPVASIAEEAPLPQVVPAVPSDVVEPLAEPLPQVPSVPIVPIPSIPAVPSVPPFPSDLVVPTVPAFPFPSDAAAAQAVESNDPNASSTAATSTVASVVTPAPASTIDSGSNSTTLTDTASFSTSSTVLSPENLSGVSSVVASRTLDSLSGQPSETATGTWTESSGLASDAAATTVSGGGGGGGAVGSQGVAAATNSAAADARNDGAPTPLETPQVVGSVVGSLAGAALILAILLLLIRRHKRRRGGALQLSDDDHSDRDQPMRQAPQRNSLVPSAFLHRFSGMSRSTAETTLSGGERSFQRVSGRKLPSAFSEGMTSDQFSRGGTISGSSFYQDDHGFYGGPGLSKEFGKEIGETPTTREPVQMSFRPSPARTPMIRHPDDIPPIDINRTHLSPPQSPNPDFPTRGTLGRSLASADGSRSSRFTENV